MDDGFCARIDSIFKMIDDLFHDGMFDVVDAVLAFVVDNYEMFDDHDVLSYLTISLPVKSDVRGKLYRKAEKTMGFEVVKGLG